jgi:hypothetical protein
MPVPTEAEGDIASPTNSTPASPADTASSGNDGNGATSPVSLADSQTLETSGEKPTKIFIGGLSWQTSFETLKEFFESNFGEVTECHIMKDQVTKKSRYVCKRAYTAPCRHTLVEMAVVILEDLCNAFQGLSLKCL